jgi:ribosome-binding factor A
VSVEEAEDEQLVSPGFSTRDISVLEVSISPDLKTARVDVSVLGGETTIKSCITWLTRHRWEIRRFLAQKMRNQKRVPELHFRESRVPQVMRTLQLIEKLAAERRERSSVSNQDRIDTAHETADRELDVDAEIRAEDLFLLTPPATSDPEASP